jgi:putative IMPACT (imprinted ancient) family translation regulator
MIEESVYNTLSGNGKAEFNDRGSKFIAYACPIKSLVEFKSVLESVKKEHPKANHHCFRLSVGAQRKYFSRE